MLYVLGEALVDMIQADFSGGIAFVPHTGGSPFNTCIALARLNTPVGFLGRFSSDFFGAMLKDALIKDGVDLSLSQEGDEQTTLGFVKTENGKDPSYAFYTNETADSMLEASLLPDPLRLNAEALVFGSISLLMEPGGSVIEDYLKRWNGSSVLSFDPNIRPVLIKNNDAFRSRCERLFTVSTIVKVSDVDLDWLYPALSLDEAAAKVGEFGPLIVVVTRGAEGAFALKGDMKVISPGTEVHVADTVGAGDTFHAGFLAWLKENNFLNLESLEVLDSQQLLNALTFAGKCAAVTCSRPGADPPFADEVIK